MMFKVFREIKWRWYLLSEFWRIRVLQKTITVEIELIEVPKFEFDYRYYERFWLDEIANVCNMSMRIPPPRKEDE